MTEARRKIGIYLRDTGLNKLLCDGLRRHTALAIIPYASIEKILSAADVVIAVFDYSAEINADDFVKHNVVPFAIASGKTSSGANVQNIFSLPFRLGTFIDAIHQSAAAGAYSKPFALGPWLVSVDGSVLTDREKTEKNVRLTEKERDILMKLHRKSGGIVDRQELLNEIWGYGKEIETHTLETHIYRLRQKIEEDPAEPRWLLTEDAGYRLNLSGNSDHNS